MIFTKRSKNFLCVNMLLSFWIITFVLLILVNPIEGKTHTVSNDFHQIEAKENHTAIGLFHDGGHPYDVYVQGNYAFVADYDDGLEIIDVSNPKDPAEVRQYWFGGDAKDVKVIGNYAYLVTGLGGGFQVLDISDPTNPILKDNYTVGYGEYNGLFVKGEYAYLANSLSGLEVISIQNPNFVYQVGMYDTSMDSESVYVEDDYAFVADDLNGLQIISVTIPSNPIHVGHFDNGGNARDVYVKDNLAYIADGGDGLEIIDVSDPSTPTLVNQFEDGGFTHDIMVVGNYAYLADATDGIEVIDISNPYNLEKIDQFGDGGQPMGVFYDRDYLYVADYLNGLEIYKLTSFPVWAIILVSVIPSIVVVGLATFLLIKNKEKIANKINHSKERKRKTKHQRKILQDELLSEKRAESLRKIIKSYTKIPLDSMAQLLEFTDAIELQKWIMDLPDDLALTIDGTDVLIPATLKNDQSISKMTDNIASYFHTCYYCAEPLEERVDVCPKCNKEVLRCVVCKLGINFGDSVGKCSLCEAVGHMTHLQEWLKVNGKCPHCQQQLPPEGIVILEPREAKKKK